MGVIAYMTNWELCVWSMHEYW